MSKEKNIKKGGLAEKMAGYTPEPPEAVWENVAAQVHGGNSRKKFLVLLSAAAGIALALTVGINMLTREQGLEFVGSADVKEENRVPGAEQADTGNDSSALASMPVLAHNDGELLGATEEKKEPKSRDRLEDKVIQTMQEVIQEKSVPEGAVLAMTENVSIIADSGEVERVEPPLLERPEILSPEINEDSLLSLLHREEEVDLEPEVEEANSNSKWQLGAAVSPQISYRDVASPDMIQNTAANNSETAKMTYTGGVQVRYKQSERLTVEAGIYYNKMGVNIGEYSSFKNWRSSADKELLYASDPSNIVSLSNSMGTIVSASNDDFINNYSQDGAVADYHLLNPEELTLMNSTVNSFSQSFEYLEIPFNIRYKVFDKAFKVQLIGGLSTNFLVNNNITAITNDERMSIGEVQDIRSVNYSGNAGLGFVYELMENLSLNIEPRFRYYLHSINASYLPTTRPYTFGLYTGVNYTF